MDFFTFGSSSRIKELEEKNRRLSRNLTLYETKCLQLQTKILQKIQENQKLMRIINQLSKKAPTSKGIPKEITENLMFIIRSCHPDRHNGSKEANEVTRALLSIRKGIL